MKALSYLEFVRMRAYNEQLEYSKFLPAKIYINTDDVLICWMDVSTFYSQPFKPELITELFEGWVCNAREEDEIPYAMFVRGEGTETEYIEFGEYYDDERYVVSDRYLNRMEYIIAKARTLDDFITDCQRAGIELKWRVK